jgi:hypothetical protein
MLARSRCPKLSADAGAGVDTGSAAKECLVFTAVKPIGGDCEIAAMPLVLGNAPLATSGEVTGLSARGSTLPPSASASLRLIIAALRFFKR